MKTEFIDQMSPWLDGQEADAVAAYLRSGGWLTEHLQTKKLEEKLARYIGSRYACMLPNGTLTLTAALLALDVGREDEVIVPDLTMIASANAVLLAGAKPKLVDIEKETLCLDLDLLEKNISARTKGVMLVSLNGRTVDMDRLLKICRKHRLFLLEDAAQSLGSYWHGRHLGSFGIAGSFSFSAPKIITTGQGGALVSDNRHFMEKLKKIKDFGREKSGIDKHVTVGYNFKFTDLQAVIGLVQMEKLAWRVKRKKAMFALYRQELAGIKEVTFLPTNLEETTPWFIDILVEKREKLQEYLRENGVGTRLFYPPVHSQMPYRKMSEYRNKKFPVSKMISQKGLWLPSSSFLKDDEIKKVTTLIRNFFNPKK